MGLSFTHLLLVAIILLIFFGPSRVPDLGKSLGQAIRNFKKGLSEEEIDVTDSTKREQIKGEESSTTTQQQQKNKQSDKV